MLTTTVISAAVLLAVLCLYKDKPPTPPALSQIGD